jgi:hypothetical protein
VSVTPTKHVVQCNEEEHEFLDLLLKCSSFIADVIVNIMLLNNKVIYIQLPNCCLLLTICNSCLKCEGLNSGL